MTTYRLETTQGDLIGEAAGDDADEAKDRWARTQGYASYADAVADQVVEAEIVVVEAGYDSP